MENAKESPYQIIVIGAGAGGLVVAIGAAKAGKKVLLIENGNYGGDCTNFGCIPSKSTIAAAKMAHSLRESSQLGIAMQSKSLSGDNALERTRQIIASIRAHETPEILNGHGVNTLTGLASFIDAHTLSVVKPNGTTTRVKGENIVIATGSHPKIPEIKGIDTVPVLTNETIFDLSEVPKKLAVIGGGPIGCELAQAYHRLGADVTIIHHHENLLNKEVKKAQKVIETTFKNEGIELFLGFHPLFLANDGSNIAITLQQMNNHKKSTLTASHVLVSAGRQPNIANLNLDKVGIKYSDRGILVDAYGRTNLKNIWAVGDVAGRALFTHLAENEARAVLTSLLMPGFLKKKLDRKQPIPRVTYTDPEVASLGLNQEEAEKKYGKRRTAVYTVPFSEVDRAITTGRTEGFVQIVTKKWSSKILGATIVAPPAGEMLMEISTAMYCKLPLRKLASIIHPYPTYSLAIRKAADQWLTATIIPALKKIVGK
ncbi:MAG: FAD-dependent oxidoreductase [Chlamydiota bacterium]|nr:FAD-dependent oxidoreductase [Chlamydiota bacterium]